MLLAGLKSQPNTRNWSAQATVEREKREAKKEREISSYRGQDCYIFPNVSVSRPSSLETLKKRKKKKKVDLSIEIMVASYYNVYTYISAYFRKQNAQS